MSEHTAENDAGDYAKGYADALDDVREAIDESLNLAHLRQALRYLKPRVTPPANDGAAS